MSRITDITCQQILDSRGLPTVETTIRLNNGIYARVSVPSGKSTGQYEAYELRDKNSRYMGKGVLKAVNNVNTIIAENIIGIDINQQFRIDKLLCELDGTQNKSKLGANAILSVSICCAKAAAKDKGIDLFQYLGGISAYTMPVPLMNIINGGVHADNGLSIQEFMIAPVGAETFSEALEMGVEVFYELKSLLSKKGYSTSVGDEGGFAPDLKSSERAFEFILNAIANRGYIDKIYLCIDVAASELYDGQGYKINIKNKNKTLTADKLTEYYINLVNEYPIISIEDGLADSDTEGWKYLTYKLADKCQLVGDDLFVTNVKRLNYGIENGLGNAILIKPNQIGTLEETIEAITLAKTYGYTPIMSHRSGETEDNYIADFAVGLSCPQIKAGSLSRGERIAKYNQLLRIENTLGKACRYAGYKAFNISYK